MKNIIIVIVISIIIVLIYYYNNYNSSTFHMGSQKIYNTAYELGNNFLNKMKEIHYYDMKYPAVMFDIDDTLLDTSGKQIKPIIKLLKKCIHEGILVIIITARSQEYYNYTVDQLLANKIPYNYLFLKNDKTDDINTFKSTIKQSLAQTNDVNTIMSIGDNIIDIDGNYSGYWIKLPNHQDLNLYHLNSNGVPERIN